jgi:undecaprenyl diphosphate synthase
LDQIESSTQNENHNSDLTICLAINYGGRRDIVDATKKIIQAVQNGEISDPSTQVTETSFSNYLSTKELPELDLIIRTGGDQRLSNFLLWNAAYAELYFTDVLWPDFNEKYLTEALEWYSRRDRRFGGRKHAENNVTFSIEIN